jgi:plastocyanin
VTPPAAEDTTVVTAEPVEEQPRGKDLGWTLSGLVIVLAYVILVVGFLMMFSFDVPDFLTESWPFLVPGLLFVAILGGLSRPWTHLVAGILVALPAAFVLFGFMVLGGLADPTRGIESQVAALMAWALLWALPAAFVGFTVGNRGKDQGLRGSLRRRHGTYVVAVACLFGAFFVAAVLATVAADSADDAYDFEPDDRITIVIEDFEFVPENFTLSAGNITEIVVENRDGAYHTFTYELDGVEYDHAIPGGQTVSFLVRFTEPDSIPYWCVPHSSGEDHDEGMVGTIEVEE